MKGKPDGTLHILAVTCKYRPLEASDEFTIRVDFVRGGQVTPTTHYAKAHGATYLSARATAASKLLDWLEREVNQNHDQ